MVDTMTVFENIFGEEIVEIDGSIPSSQLQGRADMAFLQYTDTLNRMQVKTKHGDNLLIAVDMLGLNTIRFQACS